MAVALLGAMPFLSGCEEKGAIGDPPLRPLLYTQGNEGNETALPGYEPWQDHALDPIAWPLIEGEERRSFAGYQQQHFDQTTPEGTIRAAFAAAAQGDQRALNRLMLDAEGLESFAQYSPAGARARSDELRQSVTDFIDAFRAESPADSRDEGITSILQTAEVRIGAPRLVTGEVVDVREDATMFSTNALKLHILGTNIDFDVRFPRLIRGDEGNWYIAEPPNVSATWTRFRRPGLDLKPELLRSENAPFPFEVGNYWHFDAAIVSAEASGDEEEGVATVEPQRWAPARDLSFRDTVSDLYQGENYLVVSMRRTFSDPQRDVETSHLLVTPRHIYPCSRTCYRQRADVTSLLSYMGETVPLWVFPLQDERVWGVGGVDTGASARTTTREVEGAEVPAGRYAPAWTSRELRSHGVERVTMAPGVGPVRIVRSQPEGILDARLRDYRILR